MADELEGLDPVGEPTEPVEPDPTAEAPEETPEPVNEIDEILFDDTASGDLFDGGTGEEAEPEGETETDGSEGETAPDPITELTGKMDNLVSLLSKQAQQQPRRDTTPAALPDAQPTQAEQVWTQEAAAKAFGMTPDDPEAASIASYINAGAKQLLDTEIGRLRGELEPIVSHVKAQQVEAQNVANYNEFLGLLSQEERGIAANGEVYRRLVQMGGERPGTSFQELWYILLGQYRAQSPAPVPARQPAPKPADRARQQTANLTSMSRATTQRMTDKSVDDPAMAAKLAWKEMGQR